MNRSTLRLVMKKAWGRARKLQVLNGGSVVRFLSIALKEAWAELKADPVHQMALTMMSEAKRRRREGVPLATMGRNSHAAAYFSACW
ncbi:hypothetical protein [Fodinicurvata sediminis]|uniref:hypothetical protein n=1 Tax=Fodinicurvata sediminis TaxID=1121832 RepID=UPI0003B71717|nr:hypothetical protein [Fodinicurvata sediminis]